MRIILLAILLTACASGTSEPVPTHGIVFITLTPAPALVSTLTDEPLPFRDLSTLTPTASAIPPSPTPAPETPTTVPAVVPTNTPAANPQSLVAIQPTSALLVQNPAPTAQLPAPTAAAVQPPSDVASAEQAVIDLSNAYRAANGLPPLHRDEAVMAIARSRSADMVARDYFDHTDPITGVHLAKSQVLALGYGRAGENIYWGGTALADFPANAVNWFINDAPHRDNILGSGYTVIGVGIVWNGRGWALTQNFGGP